MEETPNQANAKAQEQFGIQSIYIKDISFESPNSPQIFTEEWKPQLEMEMSNTINKLENQDAFEVVLNLTVTVKAGEKTAFLIEIHQGGIFAIKGFTKDKLSYMLNSYCPNILFPYAREAVSSIVTRGGFQALWLSPLNFDALYAQRLQQQQETKPKQQETKPTND
ncbi:MAG: protein-export chaperone SecB [Thiomargarita sp.]|nr:protein-export chaperone SecB [Thiomargarita sp.]